MNNFINLKIILLLFLGINLIGCQNLYNNNSQKQNYNQLGQSSAQNKMNPKISSKESNLDDRIIDLINETVLFFQLNQTADLQIEVFKAKVLIVGNYTDKLTFNQFIQLINQYPYISKVSNYSIYSHARSRSEIFGDKYSKTKLKQALIFNKFAKRNEILKIIVHQSVGYAIGVVDAVNMQHYVDILQSQDLTKLVILFTGDGELPKTPNTPRANKTLKKIKFTDSETIEKKSQELEVLNPQLNDDNAPVIDDSSKIDNPPPAINDPKLKKKDEDYNPFQ